MQFGLYDHISKYALPAPRLKRKVELMTGTADKQQQPPPPRLTAREMVEKVKRCVKKGYSGHTARYDMCDNYRQQCITERLPRQLILPAHEGNPPIDADVHVANLQANARGVAKAKRARGRGSFHL